MNPSYKNTKEFVFNSLNKKIKSYNASFLITPGALDKELDTLEQIEMTVYKTVYLSPDEKMQALLLLKKTSLALKRIAMPLLRQDVVCTYTCAHC